ncbi:MAG: ABC transporter permease [Cyclobacteriaceae bacterium]|nr:ABC transporter permease [Cyclobacteriaceae bacterium HetDA_MAG_MS6]
MSSTPPKYPRKILTLLIRDELVEEVLGDLEEKFYAVTKRKSLTRAKLNYWYQIVHYFRPFALKTPKYKLISPMFRNYLKLTLRNSRKEKYFTAINLVGLTLGLASAILISLWIKGEREVDAFHKKSDSIFQVWRNMYQSNGEVHTTSYIPKPLREELLNTYPEVDDLVVLSWPITPLLQRGTITGKERGFFASPSVFNMFSFELLAGDQANALPHSTDIVISDYLAEKYFGAKSGKWHDVIGQSIIANDDTELTVSGVFKQPNAQSSLSFDWLRPAESLIAQHSWMEDWGSGSFRFFIETAPINRSAVAGRILNEINNHSNDEVDERLILQPFSERYLHSKFENGVIVGGRITYIRIMLIAALLIVMMACINAMNLVTAQSFKRNLEVGVRKVLGESRASIRLQFFVESLMLTATAMGLAIIIVAIALPLFNRVIEANLFLNLHDMTTWAIIGITVVSVSFLTGLYPALMLPAIKVIHSLKGKIIKSNTALNLRQGLVVFQFSISILLIIGAVVISQQLGYILNKDLGLDHNNLVMIDVEGSLDEQFDTYRNELMSLPEVEDVTGATGNPISYGRSTGSANWDGKDPQANWEINVLGVGDDFLHTMKADLLSGRSFSREYGADSMNYLINEVAAELMGFQDPLNQRLSIWGIEGQIIGVVKNFHMLDLYEPIAPLIIRYDPSDLNVALIRVNGTIQPALQKIERITSSLNPEYPFDPELLANQYKRVYTNEVIVGKLAKLFAIVSITISCLGLLALSTYASHLRTKEIGIRKVYGAGVIQLILMLSREYVKLFLLSMIIGLPIAYYYAHQWLNHFEFRTEVSPWSIVAGVLVIAGFGLLTVCYKSYEAATANPIKGLRSE